MPEHDFMMRNIGGPCLACAQAVRGRVQVLAWAEETWSPLTAHTSTAWARVPTCLESGDREGPDIGFEN